MRFYLLAFLCVLLCPVIQSQGTNPIDAQIFDMEEVDRKPQFPGGQWRITDFFESNIQLPSDSPELHAIDEIKTEFVVEPDGRITELGFPIHTLLDDSVRQLFNLMPLWEPGKHEGRFVRVRFRQTFFINIH